MPSPVTDLEQQKLAAAAFGRAEEQRTEASRAQAIADRDESIVAGEDTERAATTSANLARSQLSASAGGGAAAIAGMQAAQQTRDKEFAALLQRARDRKDTFEQKAVDRRNQALQTFGKASTVEQARLRDKYLSEQIDMMMKEREELQQQGLLSATQYDSTEPSKIPEFGKPIVFEGKPLRYPDDGDEYRRAYNALEQKDGSPRLKDAREETSNKEALMAEARKLYDILITAHHEGTDTGSSYGETFTQYKGIVQRLKALGVSDDDIPSDERLKYKDAGPRSGISGDANQSHAKAVQKAEEMFADNNGGELNEALVARFHR